jgi:glycosyltransferase involved in cell wall biosynthesis
MDNPLVSVIIPVYNGERFIAQALHSVMAQDYKPFEIIVVDDGSVDGTADIVKSIQGIQYIYQANQGHGAAKNKGIEAAEGSYLAFLDADDLWEVGKLSQQIEHMIRNPDFGFVICNKKDFLEPGTPLPDYMEMTDLDIESPGYIPSCMLVRRQAFQQVGNFNPELSNANDIDWCFRAKDAGIKMGIINQCLVRRRIHESNLSHRRSRGSNSVQEMFRVVRASTRRKRESKP